MEGQPNRIDGLGLLDIDTVIATPKTLSPFSGLAANGLGPVSGYEMHMGRSTGPGTTNPFLLINGRPEGSIAESGAVAGCYVHGLFAGDAFRHQFLDRIRARESRLADFGAHVDGALDEIAGELEAALEIDALINTAARRDGPR